MPGLVTSCKTVRCDHCTRPHSARDLRPSRSVTDVTDPQQRPVVVRPVPPRPAGALDTSSKPARHPAIFWPDEFTLEEEGDAPRPARVPTWGERLGRSVVFGVSGVVAVVGAVAVYALLARPSRGAASPDVPASPVAPLAMIDSRADTLGLAVAAFELRATMFGRRQMGCAELAHGLVQVDDAWMAYSFARRHASPVLDSARDGRDRELFAQVKAVERRFESSACARP